MTDMPRETLPTTLPLAPSPFDSSTGTGANQRKRLAQCVALSHHEGLYPRKRRKVTHSSVKRVRFDAVVDLRRIPKGSANTWLSRAELASIKRRAKRLVIEESMDIHNVYETCCGAVQSTRKADRPEMTNSPYHHACQLLMRSTQFRAERGPERWSSLTHYRTRAIQTLACKTNLFIEQSSQLLEDKRDDEKLAALYRSSSQASALFAQVVGMADRIVASYA
jgi:hypothetical protein